MKLLALRDIPAAAHLLGLSNAECAKTFCAWYNKRYRLWAGFRPINFHAEVVALLPPPAPAEVPAPAFKKPKFWLVDEALDAKLNAHLNLPVCSCLERVA